MSAINGYWCIFLYCCNYNPPAYIMCDFPDDAMHSSIPLKKNTLCTYIPAENLRHIDTLDASGSFLSVENILFILKHPNRNH